MLLLVQGLAVVCCAQSPGQLEGGMGHVRRCALADGLRAHTIELIASWVAAHVGEHERDDGIPLVADACC